MTAFRYSALDETGNRREGEIFADNRPAAALLLQDRGLKVVRIEASAKFTAPLFAATTMDRRYWAVFCRRLAILTDIMSVYEALRSMAEQEPEHWLQELCQAVAGGHGLGEAMLRQKQLVPVQVAHLTIAGERSGRLPEILTYLADYLEQEAAAGEKFRAAMLYPALLGLATGAAVLIMFVFILPAFVTLFDNMMLELPLSTRILLNVGQFVVANDLLLLNGIVILVALLLVLNRHERCGRSFDYLKLKLPVFGELWSNVAWLHILSALAMMQRSGLRLTDALPLVTEAADNRYMTYALNEARQRIEHGSTLKAALDDMMLSPTVLGLIDVGERAGRLEEMLQKSADYTKLLATERLNRIQALAEPLMILIVGLFVVVLVLSIVLPVLDIIDGLT